MPGLEVLGFEVLRSAESSVTSGGRPGLAGVWPTLFVAWVAFAQVVSFQGLAIWVVGASILCAWVVFQLAGARRLLPALVVTGVLSVGIAGLAEWVGGSSAGPITRASLMACGIAGAMAVVVTTRSSAAVIPLSLLLLAGALGLGAAREALWISGLWVVAAAVTLVMVGPYRQSFLRERAWPLARMLMVPGVVAVGVMAVAAMMLPTPWTQGGSAGARGVRPPEVPESVTSSPPREDMAPETPSVSVVEAVTAAVRESVPGSESVSWWWWLVLAALAVAVFVLGMCAAQLAWRVWVAWRWARTRRRLARGTPSGQVVGAWTWVRLRRARYESPLPVHLSPDVGVTWASIQGDADLQRVAEATSRIAFHDAGEVPAEEAQEAWACARRAGRPPRASLRQRWRWAAVTPRVSEKRCVLATR